MSIATLELAEYLSSLDGLSAYEYLTTLPDESAHCVVLRECVYTRLYESLRILRPGGVCLVFSTTKTLNTTFKNLEEAGFIIRDVIAWVNPSIPASSFGMSHLIARSQDLEEAWHDAGQFYWGKAQSWLDGRHVFSRHGAPVPLPRHRVQDIDTHEDWIRAEWLFKAMNLTNGNTQ